MLNFFRNLFTSNQNPPAPPPVVNPNQNLDGYRFIRTGLAAVIKTLILTTTALSLYLENAAASTNNETAENMAYASIVINMAAFILEVGLNYYENNNARVELRDAKRNFTSAQTVFNNIVPTTVTPTTSLLKAYGLKDSAVVHTVNIAATLLNVGSNVVNLLAKSGPIPQTPAAIPVLATNLAGIGIEWLHQHYIQHNLSHEERLYKAARSHILNTITQAQQGVAVANNAANLPAPQNIAPVTYRR